MDKEARINCRTTWAVRRGLEEYAQRNRMTIDAALELILTGFLECRAESFLLSSESVDGGKSRLGSALPRVPSSGEPFEEGSGFLDLSVAGLAKASAVLLGRLAE